MLFDGSFITRASGSLGEITASHNRGGQYLRARVTPTDPATALQQTIRDHMTTVSSRWSTVLNRDQIDTWREYASNSPYTNALGNTHVLTGQQQYVRTNVVRLQLSLSIIDEAPTVFTYAELPIITSVFIGLGTPVGTGDFTVGFQIAPAAGFYGVWAGKPQPLATNWFRGPWRFLGKTNTDTLSGAMLDYGYAGNDNVWIYARLVSDDGSMSGKTQDGPTIVSA